MRQAGQLRSNALQLASLESGQGDPLNVGCLLKDSPPRIYHAALPPGRPPFKVLTHLPSRDYIALVLNGTSPQQNLPMVSACLQGKRRRHR